MKQCNVCKLTESKYRCPTCRILYCSVQCYKSHKDTLCKELKLPQEPKCDTVTTGSYVKVKQEPGELIDESDDDDELDTKDKVSQKKLSLLENSQTIKDMLTNKHLQQVLTDIDKDENGQIELDAAMKLPIFTEFANECLKLVDDKFEDTVK